MEDFLNRLPGYNLRRASTVILSELTDGLSELELRPSDASMLITIDSNPRITPSELGRILGIQRANMVPMVARLEDRGEIVRIKRDGRSFGLELTQQGSELCNRAKAILLEYEDRFLLRVPAEHREHLLPALRALWDQTSA
tara:strand:+ start:140 stop:562 length:423 start_codon:yes stop_codon:yes gene_type:complete